MANKIFVFGSNLAGRHGKGAALHAYKKYEAVYGIGEGIQGNSYAIPTKDHRIRTLPLEDIRFYIHKFLSYATNHPELEFNITNIGCGLAGYTPKQIAPMFKGAPENCRFSKEFQSILDA